MSGEGENTDGVSGSGMEDAVSPEKQMLDTNGESNENLVKENGVHIDDQMSVDDPEKLLEMVMDLKLQNEYLKSQIEGLMTVRSDNDADLRQQKEESGQESRDFTDAKELHDKIEALSKELHEEKQTRTAAEKAVEHLRVVYEEADSKAQEFSVKLVEGLFGLLASMLWLM